jgi:hypothetical protein
LSQASPTVCCRFMATFCTMTSQACRRMSTFKLVQGCQKSSSTAYACACCLFVSNAACFAYSDLNIDVHCQAIPET